MYRSFIAITLVAALALTGLAAPARAGSGDVAKTLLGLAVIAGIAVAIDNRNDRRRVVAPVQQRRYVAPVQQRRNVAPVQNHQHATPGHRRNQANPGHRRHQQRALPARCLRTFETYRGTRYGFGENCLSRRADRISPPEQCSRRGQNRRGRWITFYGERCMARQGFRVSRN